MFDEKFGNVGAGGLSGNQLENLKTALSAKYADGKDAATQINNGLKAAFSASKNTSQSGGTTGIAKVLGGGVDTAFGVMYDRYLNDNYRFGQDKLATLLKDLGSSVVSFNLKSAGQSLLKFLADNTKDAASNMAAIDDHLIETLKEKGMMVGEIGNHMKEELRDTLPYAQNLGVGPLKFLSGVENLIAAQGKFITYSEKTLDQAVLAGRAFTDDAMDIMKNVDNFRNVGLGLADAANLIDKIGHNSLNVGLNAKETTKTVMSNLDKLNQYGFKNGVEGLSRMVQQAQALKVGMDATFKIAEKAFDPEGAIDLSARLQVIGGAMGDFNDPLRMMYDATNNVEGLQTSLIGAASSLATFNNEQGRFEVTGANLRKAKAMADAFGITMGELTNMATKGAAKLEAMSELDMFPSLTDDQKEFASNLAQMKDGKIGIEVPKDMMDKMGLKDSFVQLSDLNSGQLQQIVKMQEDNAKLSTKDIALEQMNETTKIKNTLSAILLQLGTLGYRSSTAKAFREGQKGFREGLYEYGQPGGVANILNYMKENASAELGKLMQSMNINEEDLGNFKKGAQGVTNEIIDNTKDLYEKTKAKIEEAIKGFTGKIDVNLHIDASHPDSSMLANAINRSPQIKSDLSEALSTGVRSYFASQTSSMG